MAFFGANPYAYSSSSSQDSYDGPISFARVGNGQFEMIRLPDNSVDSMDDTIEDRMIEALGVHRCPYTGRLLHAHQTVGHPAAPMWSPQLFVAEPAERDDDSQEWELQEQDAQEELDQYKHWLKQKYLPPVAVLAMNQNGYGPSMPSSPRSCKGHAHKRDIIDESLLDPADRAMLHKAQTKARQVHAVGTGVGAVVGFGLGGPVGAAIGGAGGNVLSSQLYPTPNRVRNIKTVAADAFWAGAVSGLSPVLVPSAWAALAGGAIIGYNTR